jgi:hypothetical protein
MLSRTAENIFWMARYIERAESTARLIQMGQRMAILPGPIHRGEWRSVLRVTGCDGLLEGDRAVAEADIVRLLLLDEAIRHRSDRACCAPGPMGGRCAPRSPKICGRPSTTTGAGSSSTMSPAHGAISPSSWIG